MSSKRTTTKGSAWIRVSSSGRLSIPKALRRAAGLERRGSVLVEQEEIGLRILTLDDIVSRSQALTRRLLLDRPDASFDDFLAERRREARGG
jgi:bifunctional DNA-binding transcriptional regulator/antitoxin component of YhaV-PrlF toxin-antitoxin module